LSVLRPPGLAAAPLPPQLQRARRVAAIARVYIASQLSGVSPVLDQVPCGIATNPHRETTCPSDVAFGEIAFGTDGTASASASVGKIGRKIPLSPSPPGFWDGRMTSTATLIRLPQLVSAAEQRSATR